MAHFSLGAALLKQGKCSAAIPPLVRAFSLNPRLGEAQIDLAIAEYCLGHYIEARKHVDLGQALGVRASPDFVAALDTSLPQDNR